MGLDLGAFYYSHNVIMGHVYDFLLLSKICTLLWFCECINKTMVMIVVFCCSKIFFFSLRNNMHVLVCI